MIFKIDTLPLVNDFRISSDYISRLIYTAITDPLFMYDSNTLNIQECACKNIITDDYQNYTITIKSNLFFADGTPVIADDYVEVFKGMMNEMNYAALFIKNIEAVYSLTKNSFIIKLKEKDFFFKGVLTMYQFAPRKKNGVTSGPYYLFQTSESRLVLRKNNYYRNANSLEDEIVYLVSEDYDVDIDEFNCGKIDLTNNTTFPYDRISEFKELTIKPSYIWACINFSPLLLSSGEKIRKKIASIIDRDEIAAYFDYYMIPSNDFYVTDYSSLINVRRESKKEINITSNCEDSSITEISFGYDEFYPNELIANLICNQLSKHGIKCNLIKNVYGKKNDNDINLVLMYPPFFEKPSFYLTKHFEVLAKITKNKQYLEMINVLRNTGDRESCEKIADIFGNTAPIIPLVKMNSIYLCKRKYSDFSFTTCNYGQR